MCSLTAALAASATDSASAATEPEQGGPVPAVTTGNPTASGNGAPGVSATQITTGAVSTLTGPLAGDLSGIVPGVKAYFDMVNAEGGIDGRRLDLAYSLDDGGNPSQFTALARDLVDEDHVFAVTGVGTDFFSPNYFKETGTPTYGFNTTGGWEGPPNLFGSDGSVQCYSCLVPHVAYLVKRTHTKSVALLAYNVSASSDLCAATSHLLTAAGVKVSYQDLNAPIDGDLAPDVERIARAHSDMVISCMDTDGNISMARAIQQYGLHATQLWFSGYDQSLIDRYSNLMQGVYFFVPNVPLTAPTKYYPGLALYLDTMRRYEPQYVNSALAIQGWISASLFAAGVRAAGSDLTQQRVVQLTNEMTDFNADGLIPPVSWKDGHTTATGVPPGYPICAAFTRVEGRVLRSVFGTGHQVFVCLAAGSVRHPVPVPAPRGTPGT